MRWESWDKTVVRILLIFSIANIVLTAPALVRQRRLVTDRADDEPTDESEKAPGSLAEPVRKDEVVPATPPSGWSPTESEQSLSDSELLDWLNNFLGEGFPPNSPSCIHHDPVPMPLSSSLHQDLVPVSGAPESHDDLTRTPPSPWGLHTTERPPGQLEVGESSRIESGTLGGSPPASGAQPLLDDKNPWHDDTTLWWHDLSPITDVERHFHRSFEWSSERERGHRFSWGVRFCSLPSLSR
jgi:hypothetical protein